jgi:hypothetical protein
LFANKVFAASMVLGVFLLLLLHGLLPGMAGTTVSIAPRFMVLGIMECGAYSLAALADLKCPLVGGSSGGLLPTGSPVYVAGALLVRFLSLSPEWALLIVATIIMGISLAGAYKLIGSFGVSRYVALMMAFLYLITPAVMSMQSFGGTYWGFLLLPAALWAVRFFLSRLRGASWKTSDIDGRTSR